MHKERRNRLIDSYFEALDEDDFETLRPALTESTRYQTLGHDLQGVSEIETYVKEDRSVRNSNHELTLRAHDEAATACEGIVTGDTPDGRINGGFCDVFEFDENDETIERITVYTRLD